MSQPSRRSSRSVSSAGSQRTQADAARAELQVLEEESVLKEEALAIETIQIVSLLKQAAMADAKADALGSVNNYTIKK